MRRQVLLPAIVPGDGGAALPGQDLPGGPENLLRVHVAHHHQAHVGGGIKRLVAVVQGLGRDPADALHGPGHRLPHRAVAVQGLHHLAVYLPLGVVLDHADLLGDDALFLFHALVGEIRHGHEGQQNPQIFIKMLGAVEIIGGDGVAGEGVGLGPALGQLLHGAAVRRVEHLVLQIVGDAGGGVQPPAVQLKAHIHAAVAGGEEGELPGIAGLGHHAHRQAVGQSLPQDLFPDAGIYGGFHQASSFPCRKYTVSRVTLWAAA